jgi:hypothetical protein
MLRITLAVSRGQSQTTLRLLIVAGLLRCSLCSPCWAQDSADTFAGTAPNLEVLSAEQWRQVDAGVDHGLEFLARQQHADGSF